MVKLSDRAQFQELARIESVAAQLFEPTQIDDRVFLSKNIGESALGETAMQRHLAALKSPHAGITGDRFRAFCSAPRIFTAARAHALADALILVLLPLGRFQLAEIH